MDAPVASLMLDGFLKGYEQQAEKEEEEAEEIVNGTKLDALKALCTRYDNKIGEYPEHKHEGAAVLAFFEKLKDEIETKKRIMKRDVKNE